MKIIFSKSTDHVEHFHILRFFHISRNYGATVLSFEDQFEARF